ncbi:MAG: XrtA system polysaccharide chain length determinant [Terracidiphilus sp.]|jgi:polysaccharide chain length determinant protein (PEP-CTERM system associated)
MPEIHEDHQSEPLDLQRLTGIVRRRHLHFMIPLLVGWLAVWLASWILPSRYKSTTTILVEQPTMPQNYVVPNINDDLQSRLQSMSTQILSRTRLLMIIDRLHLYSGTQTPATADEKVDRMRKDIVVELVRDPQRQDISAFKISYSARDPHVAQQVTGELTNLFINENLKVRQQESEGTTSFIEKQLEEARENLSEQEAKVREFEGRHQGALPTQEASNLQILAGLQSQLQNEQDGLNTARQQRVYLQAMLSEERAAQTKSRPVSGGQAGQAGATDLATVDQQLESLRAQLTELSARYTDRYPDVQHVKSEISRLEATRASLLAAQRRAETSGGTDANSSAAARQLQGQLEANQLEISNRESSIENLKARINEYQGRLNMTPATEQELADLTRGYEQSKANYDDLLKKKNQSEMATSMEQMQQGERFTMLDPPSLPTKPDFPNRLQFCGIGLAIGLVLGLIVAGTFEFLDDRLYTEKEIKALLPIPVISEIPEVVSSLDEQLAKKKSSLRWAASAATLFIIFVGSAVSYLHN